MKNNDVIVTSGWTEAYEIHYSGGYGVWTEGHIGDAAITVSYCHSPGVEAFLISTKRSQHQYSTMKHPSNKLNMQPS